MYTLFQSCSKNWRGRPAAARCSPSAVGYQPSDTVRIGDLFQERGLEVTVIGVRLAYSREGVPVVANIAGANL